MPGLVEASDKTQHLLTYGYWASYNIPYFPDMALSSGAEKLCQADSNNCYSSDPRARLFRRYEKQVTDMKSIMWILGYNDFKGRDSDLSSLDR